jgi:hypothetical protein
MRDHKNYFCDLGILGGPRRALRFLQRPLWDIVIEPIGPRQQAA